MAFPLSIGEAALLAKIAWTVGQVFTRVGKSVPAEFREVENQLYSLSAALAALDDALNTGAVSVLDDKQKFPITSDQAEPAGAHHATISGILTNCRQTLTHLERIVDKYTIIITQADPGKPRLRRWSQSVVKNYRRIAWTLEDGDLATLRSQLMVHTSSLELILNIAINSRASKLQEGVEENTGMLKDIHTWWEQNLKHSSPPIPETVANTTPAITLAAQSLSSTPAFKSFTFHMKFENGNGQSQLCSIASLTEDWDKPTSRGLFVCRCGRQDGSVPVGLAKHRTTVEGITLSPLSFVFRRAGGDAASWTLFKVMDTAHSHRLVSVIISNVPTHEIPTFETLFVHRLANMRAVHMLQQGIENMLAYIDPDSNQPLVLNIHGGLGRLHQQVESVVLRSGNRYLTKTNVNGLDLLHYRGLYTITSQDGHTPEDSFCDHAELHAYSEQDQAHIGSESRTGDTTKILFQLKHDTNVSLCEGVSPKVVLEGITCIGYMSKSGSEEETTTKIEQADVSFLMTTVQTASILLQKLQDIQMELRLILDRELTSYPERTRAAPTVHDVGPAHQVLDTRINEEDYDENEMDHDMM